MTAATRSRPRRSPLAAAIAVVALGWGYGPAAWTACEAADAAASPGLTPSPERGYRHLLDQAYVPAAFSEADVEALPSVWPASAREAAEAADATTRRALIFARYGLTPRPDDPRKPLQYAVDGAGRWSLNCFSCHGGQVGAEVIPGAPNAHFAFADLMDDVARVAAARKDLPTTMAVSLWRRIPLGGTHGLTNAVVFSRALGAFRDDDLRLVPPRSAPEFVHHDLDAPPWWNVSLRSRLYIDGATKKSHRALMQFLMVPSNGPDRFAAWEDDFRDVLAYLESLRPPSWPGAIDASLAARGRTAFERVCSACHGTYGERPAYPGVVVSLKDVGTDPVRLRAIPRSERERYARSWFTEGRRDDVDLDPKGYVAPPLRGIWASAPYLHNGSVPTLWHVLRPSERPRAFRRRGPSAYDVERVGLDVETRDAAPTEVLDAWERRSWHDTTQPGKSASGHTYPDALSEDERRAVLEYLKTL